MTDQSNEFVQAYTNYRPALLRHCRRQVADPEVAEELVQEAFLRTWEYLQEHPVQHMRTFLFRVLDNMIIDQRRRNNKGEAVSLDVLAEKGFEVGQDTLEHAHQSLDAHAMLEHMKSSQMEYKILSMRYLEGLRVADIARKTGLTVRAVGMRLHRVLRRLNGKVRPHSIAPVPSPVEEE